MSKLLGRQLKRFFAVPYACHKMIISRSSFLHKSGWMESLKRGYPCKQDGSQLPWMNYPAIHFLENRLNAELTMFEFGSGFSTEFYAKRVKSIVSVEYDLEWFKKIEPKLPENARLIHQLVDQDGKYCRTIQNLGQPFDVVVVDGRDRVNCIKQSIESLSGGGVIILDDSQRDRYQDGLAFAQERGFSTLEFHGVKPTHHKFHSTTLMYRSGNCLSV